MTIGQAHRDRWRRYWDKHSASYDKDMRFFDRVLFGDSRAWICLQATGNTLEVAIGTGLNLPLYPPGIRLTGIDYSPAMLAIAKQRAQELGRDVDLREADAHALPFPDASLEMPRRCPSPASPSTPSFARSPCAPSPTMHARSAR